MTAASSGTAISARPRSINPLNDLGRAQRMAHSQGQGPGCPRRRRRALLPGLALQTLFPLQRGAHDGVEIIEARLPSELAAHAVRSRDQCRRISSTTRLFLDGQRSTGDALDAPYHLAHAVAMTVPDIQHRGV